MGIGHPWSMGFLSKHLANTQSQAFFLIDHAKFLSTMSAP